jgi:hypothetical protein
MGDWVTQAGGGDTDEKRTWKAVNALPPRPTQRTAKAADELERRARGDKVVVVVLYRRTNSNKPVHLAADLDLEAFEGDGESDREAQLNAYEEAWASFQQKLQVGLHACTESSEI